MTSNSPYTTIPNFWPTKENATQPAPIPTRAKRDAHNAQPATHVVGLVTLDPVKVQEAKTHSDAILARLALPVSPTRLTRDGFEPDPTRAIPGNVRPHHVPPFIDDKSVTPVLCANNPVSPTQSLLDVDGIANNPPTRQRTPGKFAPTLPTQVINPYDAHTEALEIEASRGTLAPPPYPIEEVPVMVTPDQTNTEQAIERLESVIEALYEVSPLLADDNDKRAMAAWSMVKAASELAIAASQILKQPLSRSHSAYVTEKITRGIHSAQFAAKALKDNS